MRQKSIAGLGPILLIAALIMTEMSAPAQAAPPYDPSASYKIINKKSGTALSVHQGGSANGSRAILWDFINAEDQLWHLVDIGGGFYRIVNNHSGKVLSTLNGGSDNGTIIHIWDYLTTFPDQHWVISPGSSGFVKITNRNGITNQLGGGTVSCRDGGTANDTTVHLWHYLCGFDDQDWSIIPVTATQNTVSGMWRSFSKGSATGSYSVDAAAPFRGSQSQRISYISGDGEIGIENQSLNRWGMNVQAAKPYDGYVYLRNSTPTTV